MTTFYQLLGLLSAGIIVWILYRTVKGKPELFNRENINKSFLTMGALAIFLIVFVALLVVMVRTT